MLLSNKKSTPYPRVGLWKVPHWTPLRIETNDHDSSRWVHLDKDRCHVLVFAQRDMSRWRAIVQGEIVLIDSLSFWDMTYMPCDGDGVKP